MKQSKLLLLMLLLSSLCSAQITMSYSIGCIGNTNAKEPVFSSPVVVTGKACFHLSNGVSLFEKNKTGVFTAGCEVLPGRSTVTKLNITAYPNPVISNVTIKSLSLLTSSELLLVTIYNTSGMKVKDLTTNPQALSDGVNIQLGGLPKGVYFGKISSAKVAAEFKLIKIE